jgi:hypothetical protein
MKVPALENKQDRVGGKLRASSVPSGRVKTLDDFLDLQHLDVLLSSIGLTHGCRVFSLLCEVFDSGEGNDGSATLCSLCFDRYHKTQA